MSSNIRINRICQFCGNEFVAKTTKTRFCSLKCGSKNYKLITRHKTIDVSNQETESIRNYDLEVLKKQDFFTVMQCGQLFGISRRTIYRMISRNDLDIVKLGRRTLISKDSINNLFVVKNCEEADKTDVAAEFDIANCYTISQAQSIYKISQGGLYFLIKKHDIKEYISGKYTYVQKKDLDIYLKGTDHE